MLNNIVTLKYGLEVTRGHSNWYHSKTSVWFLSYYFIRGFAARGNDAGSQGRCARLASPRARKAARSFAATHGRVHVPTTINIEMAPSSMFSAIKRNIG